MYLSCEFPVLKIFGFGDGSEDINGPAGDVLYASYLSMARAGLASLEMWDPKSQKWGQAHSQARFSILKSFLEAGDDFCKLDYTKDDLSDLTIKLDRSKILTAGRKGKFYMSLHIEQVTKTRLSYSRCRLPSKASRLQVNCRRQDWIRILPRNEQRWPRLLGHKGSQRCSRQQAASQGVYSGQLYPG